MNQLSWNYTLIDAVQLMVPWAGLLMLTVLLSLFFMLYKRLKVALYRAGLFISIVSWVYIACEALLVTYGWVQWDFPPALLHRFQGLVSLWLIPALLYVIITLYEDNHKFLTIVKGVRWASMAVILLVSLVAYLLPDSFITSSVAIVEVIRSPIDFAHGATGPLYIFHDIYLAFFMILFVVLAFIHFIKNRGSSLTFFFIAGLLAVIMGALDDMIFFRSGSRFFLQSVAFSRVSIGITLMVILYLFAIEKEFYNSQKSLFNTRDTLLKSEEKYRLLSEGSKQAVFTLSHDLHFLQYNRKTKQIFSLYKNKNRPLDDLLRSFSPESARWVGEMLEEKKAELAGSLQTSFRTLIKDPRTGEPEEYEFQLSALPGTAGEYIGHCTRLRQGKFGPYVNYEKISLTLDNSIILLDDITTWLTHVLDQYMEPQRVMQIKMGLQEIILNAMEHGNLAVTFQEKELWMSQGIYREQLALRQNQEPYKDRVITVEYEMDRSILRYRVSDEGAGFDPQRICDEIAKKMKNQILSNGRGIELARQIFDRVSYNEKGNQVVLEKVLKGK